MSYWENTGLYQSTLNRLNKLKDEEYARTGQIGEKWYLIDAATGLYYAFYNDGDDAEGAAVQEDRVIQKL